MRTEGTCIHLHRVLHHNTQYLWGLQYSIYARFTHSEICCTDSEREIWNMQISKHEIFAYLTQSQLSLSVISVHNNVFSKDKYYSMTFWSMQTNYATTSVIIEYAGCQNSCRWKCCCYTQGFHIWPVNFHFQAPGRKRSLVLQLRF